ncbi:potassium channel subfamily K member 13-like [Amblyraja radiata]|uniref:potassium channel subfamily K member 13-like n=1 Tax=Amblyraja radiata TaxID=386614 RepID=UPI001403D86D|nr:potassium channel subfamily K member 13-like [Amblyraja radiata]
MGCRGEGVGRGGGTLSCCCPASRLNEDNARFALLALFILGYLALGAAVFSAMERPLEVLAERAWGRRLDNFSRSHNISRPLLAAFLRDYEKAHGAGVRVEPVRPRWDFPGAFYFVGTVVSTIGFGMTTPVTLGGRVFLIFYGLVGCAATILFFNLFLERTITLLAYVLRWFHQRGLERGGGAGGPSSHRPSNLSGEVDSLDNWKPSVYYVMLILGLASMVISCCASAIYSPMEGWSYGESLYFCFVAFSTIGFGDLVSSQRQAYSNPALYRAGNFLLILMGVCCLYSLFNVSSIIIKQFLNWMLRRMECRGCRHGRRRRRRPRAHCNAVHPLAGKSRGGRVSVETVCDSETEERRLSGEMISVKDFLASNKVSLAIMQKQLSETANGGPRQSHARCNGFPGGVGALAIMNNRLVETSVDR